MSTLQGGGNIVRDGLVLLLDAANTKSYPGSGTVWTDLSRSGNNGTLTNSPTFNSSNGGNIIFDGINEYGSIPATNSTKFNGTDYSIACWVKVSSIHVSQYSGIFGRFSSAVSTTYNGYFLEAANNTGSDKFAIVVANNNSFGRVFSDSTIVFNKWYYLLATSTSNVVRLYIDGLVQSTTLNFTTATIDNYPIMLGKYYTFAEYNTFFLPGSIGQCSIYNKSLSASEVLQNYNASKSRFGL